MLNYIFVFNQLILLLTSPLMCIKPIFSCLQEHKIVNPITKVKIFFFIMINYMLFMYIIAILRTGNFQPFYYFLQIYYFCSVLPFL